MKASDIPPLIDWLRPQDSDGVLHTVLLSTYGLSLSDPPFFEQDFLPTLLGLGGVRDRGYSSPANVERRLGQIYCGIVCDAHALAEGARPSLRLDVMPFGKQLHHPKIVLIHRERLIRLVISSANLTHEGFRRNREAATVLDFDERSEINPSILADFATRWLELLGPSTTNDFRRALNEAVAAARRWDRKQKSTIEVRPIWGGGSTPIWQQVVEAWPDGELLKEWLICSPFWPSPSDAETPFDVLSRGLNSRGANVQAAKLRLFTLADAPGISGRPCFPYQIVNHLMERGFNPADAMIYPVRLDALESEVPDGKAEDQRPLHAKWIYLRGERTSLLLVGSANFTRRGLGVLRDPLAANIEVGVLFKGPAKSISVETITPPIAENGIVKWSDCCAANLAQAQTEVENPPWPEFISGIELEVRWEVQPVVGSLHFSCATNSPFLLDWEKDGNRSPLNSGKPFQNSGKIDLNEEQVSALLVRRRLVVRWGEPMQTAFFPLNISSASKRGLPLVLGQDPTEQDLLAYFHGRIAEDDLMSLLIERARLKDTGGVADAPTPGRELQNYVVREFLEGLYGMEDVLRSSTSSPRIFEQALLGEFSPVSLATQTQLAFAGGRRTPTATAFQMLELLRLVENLPQPDEKDALSWFLTTRERCIEQLLKIVQVASSRSEFCESCRADAFQKLIQSVLKPKTAKCWLGAIQNK
jgi:hypothetical protein